MKSRACMPSILISRTCRIAPSPKPSRESARASGAAQAIRIAAPRAVLARNFRIICPSLWLGGRGEGAEFGDREFFGACGGRNPSLLEQRLNRHAEFLEAAPQHLAALAEGGCGDAFERRFCRGSERLQSRNKADDARCHLWGRDKGAGRNIEQDLRLCEPLDQHREPSVRLAARNRGQAFGDLALKHQGQALILADPLEPADQQRGGDVVREVSHDFAGRIRELGRIEPQRVAGDELKPVRVGRGKLAESGEASRVALDRDDPACAGGQQCPGQAAGAGADFDNGRMVEPPGSASDPARQVEVQQEVLPETLARGYAVRSDDLAQRRQRGRRWIAFQAIAGRLPAISAASRNAAIRLSGRALPWPAIANAVPWSGEVRTKGRPKVTFTPR